MSTLYGFDVLNYRGLGGWRVSFLFENHWRPLWDGVYNFRYPTSALPGAYARFIFGVKRGQA